MSEAGWKTAALHEIPARSAMPGLSIARGVAQNDALAAAG